MTWKAGGWIDYAPNGVPDFDFRQDNWKNPRSGNWSYCGPLALADCLWWFDSKLEPKPVLPPAINDNYPLVKSFNATVWDDHDPRNLPPLVADLAYRMDTDGQRTGGTWEGTYITDMHQAVLALLAERGLSAQYDVKLVAKPTFEWVAEEVARSENVLLLLGYWTNDSGTWQRVGGHFVTSSGIDLVGRRIAVSDNLNDKAESGAPGRVLNGVLTSHLPGHDSTVHNDAGNVSHDIYNAVSASGPTALWGLQGFVSSLADVQQFAGMNFVRDFPAELRFDMAAERLGVDALAAVQTDVEYALAISPVCTITGIKKASPEQVKAGEEATVILTVTGGDNCPVSERHADVMLVVDRSGSMAGKPLQDAKNAAKAFMDRLDLSAGGDQAGLVSFGDSARLDHQLTQSSGPVRTAIDALASGGSTNITEGLTVAQQELESIRHFGANRPVIVLMTDGQHNVGPGPSAVAAAAKAKGTRIITIGLGSIDEAELRGLASSPSDYHYATTSDELDRIYAQIAGTLTGMPAIDLALTDVLSAGVELTPGSFFGAVSPASVSGKTIVWKFPVIGRGETKTVGYRVRVPATTPAGLLCMNASTRATYTNSSGNPAQLDYPPACVTVTSQLKDVFCKDHPGDAGTIPSNTRGESWWASPDIWVRYLPDGVEEHQNPRGSETNYVYVRVRNRGTATMTSIAVDLYWAAGAAAIPWPGGWTPVGTANIASLAPGASAVVSLPWIPPLSGHYCFLARVHSAEDPVRYEGLVPFDNNLCQRNIHVLDPESTHHDSSIIIANPKGAPAHADVSFNSAVFPRGGTAMVEFGDATLFRRWLDAGGDLSGAQLIPGTNAVLLDVGSSGSHGVISATLGRIPLGAGESGSLRLELGAAPGDATSLGVVQRVDGEIVGGGIYGTAAGSTVYLPLVIRQ